VSGGNANKANGTNSAIGGGFLRVNSVDKSFTGGSLSGTP
jgi:hypothetical protein